MTTPEPGDTCTACGSPVLTVEVAGQLVPLAPRPSRSGLVAVSRLGDGTLGARWLKPGAEPAPGEKRHMPHARRCKGRSGANGAWREAEATRAAEGRTRRSRGRAGGFRWPVGGYRGGHR